MSDMVERVARAIVKAGGDDPDAIFKWPDPDPCWKGAIPEARAAIAAMQADAAPKTSGKLRPAIDVAHEGWAAAQKVPGEGIEDAAQRVAAIIEQDREAVRAKIAQAIEVELSMCAIANVEAPSEWIDGFEFAWKRVKEALGDWKSAAGKLGDSHDQ